VTENLEIHAYLAGPDVFYPDALQRGAEKKAKLASVGITGHFPSDNEIGAEEFHDPRRASRLIGAANEQMMLDCCGTGRIGVILANMEPYHGPSMDVGTGCEVGFMSALATLKNNIIIIGYTNDPRTFETRVIEDLYKKNVSVKNGRIYGADGMMIEAFGGVDNLMITHAVEKTGGAVVASFEEAVSLALKLATQKLDILRSKTGERRRSCMLPHPS